MTDREYASQFKDRTIQCCDCGANFVFTAGEQGFFASKRPPLSEPRRCKACRDFRRQTIHPPIGYDEAVRRANGLYPGNTHQGVRE